MNERGVKTESEEREGERRFGATGQTLSRESGNIIR